MVNAVDQYNFMVFMDSLDDRFALAESYLKSAKVFVKDKKDCTKKKITWRLYHEQPTLFVKFF